MLCLVCSFGARREQCHRICSGVGEIAFFLHPDRHVQHYPIQLCLCNVLEDLLTVRIPNFSSGTYYLEHLQSIHENTHSSLDRWEITHKVVVNMKKVDSLSNLEDSEWNARHTLWWGGVSEQSGGVVVWLICLISHCQSMSHQNASAQHSGPCTDHCFSSRAAL
jgi:hypothetical protein